MAKKALGRKWQVPVKVKNKNCYNLTDIDTALKGIQAKEKHNSYRALLNAVIGGGTASKIPPVGVFDLEDKDRESIKKITKLILGRDFVAIFRGNSAGKYSLKNIQTFDNIYCNNSNELRFIRQYIQELEKVEDVESIKSIAILAGFYRDMLTNKERTAPNEKKTMIDVLSNNLCIFSNIDEVIFLIDTYKVTSPSTSLGNKLFTSFTDYLTKLNNYAAEEMNREIDGILEFKRNLETNNLTFDKLQVITLMEGYPLPLVPKYNSEKETFTEFAKTQGFSCKPLYIRTCNSFNLEKRVEEPELKQKNKQVKSFEDEKSEVLNLLKKPYQKWLRYNGVLAIGDYLYTNANSYEQNLWVKNFTLPMLKDQIEKEFLYLRETENSNRMYREKLPLGAFRELIIKAWGEGDKDSAMHNLSILSPKYSKDERPTMKSVNWDLETHIGLENIKKSLPDFEMFVDNMIDAINGIVYSSLASFLTRFGAQGVGFTAKMVSDLKDNESNPFTYTKKILESANRCFRAEMGIARGETNIGEALGPYADWVKTSINFLNPHAQPLRETSNKEQVQEVIYTQIILIFEQYKKYLGL